MEEIHAVYRVSCTPEEAPARAEDIALEQTVEVPAQLITDPEIQENVVAKVTAIAADPEMEDAQRISITYNAALANGHLPQLLNLLYGNISIKPDIALTGLTLPDSLLAKFPGPHFGMEGIRAQLGVYKRPLLATAIKPRGSSYDTLAKIAGDFALGGGDIVKDDHNICDDSFEDFRERVSRCHDAVRAANAKTGGNTLYLPNVLAPTKDILDSFKKMKQIDWSDYEHRFNSLMNEREPEEHYLPQEFDDACLLCSEATAEHCHRRLVVERFKEKWGNVEIKHL